MNIKSYNFSLGTHRGRNVIWIYFLNDQQLRQQLRSRFPSAKWSQSNKAWYLPDLQSIRRTFELPQKEAIEKLLPQIPTINQKAFLAMRQQLKLKAYN